jgi:hypothetical protein
LTSVEQSLVEHIGRGEWLDLAADDEAVDEAAMRSWGESRTCRASVIRDILRGQLAASHDPHGLRLRGARITGRLDLDNLTTDVNLELKDCLLKEGLLARDARLASVTLNGCQIEHPNESPLGGDRLTCSVLDLRGARIIGHAETGAVTLRGAHIGGSLDCAEANLRNDSGPALAADGVEVGQGVVLRYGFTATGAGDFGAVRLTGAHIGGSLDCVGANLRNDSGPGLRAYRLQVDGDVYFTGGFRATGSGDRGAVRLTGAHIGGNLACHGAKLCNYSGPALLAYGIQVGQDIYLTEDFDATGGADEKDEKAVTVNLRAARVGGAFQFNPKRLENVTDLHRRLAVDGLTYSGVPEKIEPEKYRKLLRDGTLRYAAQPYQQLAAGYRALGDDRQARQTLMAQRDDQLARAPNIHWRDRLWGGITKFTLGYGYQPWRALVLLAIVVAVSCVLAWLLGSHGALAQTNKTATVGQSCTVIQQLSVGLDLNLPVGTSVARVDCDLTRNAASTTAAWLSIVSWVLRVLSWAFAALFIAGFTSAVRKT